MKTTSQKPGFKSLTGGELDASLLALQKAIFELGGDPVTILNLFRSNPDFTRAIAKAAVYNESNIVRRLLGNNFFGPEDWERFYGVHFTGEELCEIAHFPWVRELDKSCLFYPDKKVWETHFAYLGIREIATKPLTIQRWNGLHPGDQSRLCGLGLLYEEEEFAIKTTCSFRWYLMLREPVPGSEDLLYEKQLNMLPPQYEVPSAVEEFTKNILYYMKNGVYPSTEVIANSRDESSEDGRISVGVFNDALGVSGFWGRGNVTDFLRIAASRKLSD